MPAKVRRSVADLVETLRRHVRLLTEFCVRAFEQGEHDYFGEIAAKLRLLVYEHGRNRPLLLALMDEFELDIPITLGGPPIERLPGKPGSGDQVSLREFLELDAYGVRTEHRGFVMLTKKQLISVWAQQHGAAHEDWELDEEFILGRDSGLFLGGVPALALELKVTTKAVLYVANQFLALATSDLVKSKMVEKED